MKNIKKLMALVIAMVMVVATMNLGVFAESTMNETFDSTIKVTGLDEGDKVEFYQVIKWVGITDENKNDDTVVGGWQAVAPFNRVLTADVMKAVLVDDPNTDAVNDPRGITSELAGQLARLVSGTANFTVDPVPANKEAQVAIDEEGEQGMYIAIITPKDVDTVYNPVFVSSDYFANDTNQHGVPDSSYADNAAAKKSKLTLTKEDGGAEADDEHPNNDNDPSTTDVGDIVTYTVSTQIPRYGKVYEHPKFAVHDELTDLALDTSSVVVKADGTTLTKDTEYTLSASASGYLVTFKEDYLKGLSKITEITITYSAEVIGTAAKNVNEEDNQVEIIYSHNPTDEDDYKAKKDTTQHYTFTLDAKGLGLTDQYSGGETGELIKIGLDGEGKVVTQSSWTSWISPTETVQSTLAGAIFGLYKTEDDAKKGNENYYTNDVFTGTVTTDGNGKMEIKGLDVGTYYLKELKAPAGFIKDPSVHVIEITAGTKPVSVTEYYKANAAGDDVEWRDTAADGYREFTYETEVLDWYKVKVDGKTSEHYFENIATSTKVNWVKDSAKELPSSIVNTKGVELPSTGGMGTTLFYVIGAILVLGAGIILVSKRRMSAN